VDTKTKCKLAAGMKKRIALFASGKGSNAQAIIDYLTDSEQLEVALIATNNKNAGVLEIAQAAHIPALIFSREEFTNESFFMEQLKEVDYIVLAGFLWLIPAYLIKHFPDKIINIHPALLPKYGGRGMYGMKVHQTVCENKEAETGITIHFVNEHYDEGGIVLQEKVAVSADDTPEVIAQKVHMLEHYFYPRCIEKLWNN